MVLLKRRNISELCAMKQWKHWQAIVAERRLIIIPFNKTVIMTILLNANIYSDTVFNISTGFCRLPEKKGAPPLPAAPQFKVYV